MRRIAIGLLASLAFGGSAILPAAAAEITGAQLNELINQTNFVVANQCSGTLISLKYRLVLTNNHCLEGYVDKVEKDETGKDGTIEKKTREVFKDMELKQIVYNGFDKVGASTLQAKILFHTTKFDLALLQIKADKISQTIYARILPEGVAVNRGDVAYVVGNPFLLDANLTKGVVSSTTRTLQWDDPNGGTVDVDYYGIDAGVNPGNSGGSLYNDQGQLIGVPAAKVSGASGVGFAIPAKNIRAFLSDHCYEDVWNDKATEDHDACEKKKLDKVNEIRAKAGLPPIEKKKDEEDRLRGDDAVIHINHADIEKATPVPAGNMTPVQKPLFSAVPIPSSHSSPASTEWSLLGYLNSWGIEIR